MSRQKRCQPGHDADRSNAGAPSSMGDAEGLVEVEVAHVRADVSGAGESHLSVHVGSVHVHLSEITRAETFTMSLFGHLPFDNRHV